jgi:hypothetical protein
MRAQHFARQRSTELVQETFRYSIIVVLASVAAERLEEIGRGQLLGVADNNGLFAKSQSEEAIYNRNLGCLIKDN